VYRYPRHGRRSLAGLYGLVLVGRFWRGEGFGCSGLRVARWVADRCLRALSCVAPRCSPSVFSPVTPYMCWSAEVPGLHGIQEICEMQSYLQATHAAKCAERIRFSGRWTTALPCLRGHGCCLLLGLVGAEGQPGLGLSSGVPSTPRLPAARNSEFACRRAHRCSRRFHRSRRRSRRYCQ
jgi:hypothetical protein